MALIKLIKYLVISATLLVIKWQLDTKLTTSEILEDELKLEADKRNTSNAIYTMPIDKKDVKSSEENRTSNEVAFWTRAIRLFNSETLEDELRLQADKWNASNVTYTVPIDKKDVISSEEIWTRALSIWTKAKSYMKIRPVKAEFSAVDELISAVGFLSAAVIIGLPAIANGAGFVRSGIETPSFASSVQHLLFQGQISGRKGYYFSKLQSIGMRGCLNLREKLLVTTVCAVMVFLYKMYLLINGLQFTAFLFVIAIYIAKKF